jgi:hypothetical protein
MFSIGIPKAPLQDSDLATQFPFSKIISVDVAIVSLHLPRKLAMKRHNFLDAKCLNRCSFASKKFDLSIGQAPIYTDLIGIGHLVLRPP